MDFTQESQFIKLLIPLYKPKLLSTVSKLVARFFARPVTEVSCKGGQLAEKLASDKGLAERMAQMLTEIGYMKQSVEKFATELDGNYKDRNCAQHVNVNDELRTELKELYDAGVHELMADTMPAAALVVRHFDKFLALLP